MPPRKTPQISITYDSLRFYVCNLCAPTRDPEQATEQLAEGSGAGVQVGECGCQCTSAAMHSVLCQSKLREVGHENLSRQAMNPRKGPGSSEPYRATDFIQRAWTARISDGCIRFRADESA